MMHFACAIQPSSKQTSLTVTDLRHLGRTPFDDVPSDLRRKVYDVPYVELDDGSGGQLWVTRYGWQCLEHLDPERWYAGAQYGRRGKRLSEGSGAVYCLSSTVPADRSIDLVVKFSRMAQDTQLDVASLFPGSVPRHLLDAADFNDPFQEFGLLEELRNSQYGPPDLRIRTKRPLAIYSPGRRFEAWRLGRTEDHFQRHEHQLAQDQENLEPGMAAVRLSIDRQYVYVFQWVRGIDAQSLLQAGELSASQVSSLMINVIEDLSTKGFRVLDNKPGHVILRKRSNGELLKHRQRFAYALVDFELLQATEPYLHWRKSMTGGLESNG